MKSIKKFLLKVRGRPIFKLDQTNKKNFLFLSTDSNKTVQENEAILNSTEKIDLEESGSNDAENIFLNLGRFLNKFISSLFNAKNTTDTVEEAKSLFRETRNVKS